MNRILVLGGYGAVGIHAVTALVSRGSAVLEVCHRESWRVSSGVPGFGLVSAPGCLRSLASDPAHPAVATRKLAAATKPIRCIRMARFSMGADLPSSHIDG